MDDAIEKYREMQILISQKKIHSPEMIALIVQAYTASEVFLNDQTTVDLVSRVSGKEYFAFSTSLGKKSRPINRELYIFERDAVVERFFQAFEKDGIVNGLELNQAIYTIAVSFCAGIDLVRNGDRKTPGTYFEYLVGAVISQILGVAPRKRVKVVELEGVSTDLPTDYIFDLGLHRPKFHVPAKTSTRERAIQMWAHQRVLDGVHGVGRFHGTPVILTETKLDSRTLEVIEICLPEQWRLYQLHIAQLSKIYYLDMPVSYAALNKVTPPMNVGVFGEFFTDYANFLMDA